MRQAFHDGCFVFALIAGVYGSAIRFTGDGKSAQPFMFVAFAFALIGIFAP